MVVSRKERKEHAAVILSHDNSRHHWSIVITSHGLSAAQVTCVPELLITQNENTINPDLIKTLGLISFGQTRLTEQQKIVDFYYINLQLNKLNDDYKSRPLIYNGICVVPCPYTQGVTFGMGLVDLGVLTITPDYRRFVF